MRSPVPRPRMIWAVGINYRDHAAETGRDLPAAPTLFAKAPGSMIGPDEPIVVPPHVQQPDYEGELAVVIGRRAKDVPRERALEFVAGLTIAHDVSARDHQFTTGQFTWSKSFDTFCPLGPEVVSLDEVDLASGLPLVTLVNGEVMQSANTSELVFDVPALDRVDQPGTDPGSGRRHPHRHAGRRRRGAHPAALARATATSWRSRSAASAPSATRSCAGRRLSPAPAHGTRRVIA